MSSGELGAVIITTRVSEQAIINTLAESQLYNIRSWTQQPSQVPFLKAGGGGEKKDAELLVLYLLQNVLFSYKALLKSKTLQESESESEINIRAYYGSAEFSGSCEFPVKLLPELLVRRIA